MTVTLLLVLAGLLGTADSQTRAKPTRPSKIAPLQPGRPGSGVFFVLPNAPTEARKPKRTGVTCSLRILRIDPPVDAAMVGTAPGTSADQMTRNDLSPCEE
jgi:hypothetical protein